MRGVSRSLLIRGAGAAAAMNSAWCGQELDSNNRTFQGKPVKDVKMPISNANEGKTPALGYSRVRRLLKAPAEDTNKGQSDRAILATLLYHGLRRGEVCRQATADTQSRGGVHPR